MAKQPSKTSLLACFAVCALLILAMALTACNSSKTPMGSDKDVQELVLEIATTEYKKLFTSGMSHELFIDQMDPAEAKKMLAALDEEVKKANMSLQNIRTQSIQENLQKSTSAADLIVRGQSVPITYTAQITADGNLYVEVFGL